MQQKIRLAICVAVCLTGLLIMGHLFGVEALQNAYAALENSLGTRLVLFIVAALMIVFGAAGVRLPMRTPPGERKIVFHSEYGDIEIQLNSVERNIKRVLKKLPEIHKVKVRVFADETQEHAVVEADCVLAQHPDTPEHAKQMANRISGYIALMARKTMGLEELATIKVNVVNVHYDGTLPITSILEPPGEPYEPILLEHSEEQLEVLEPEDIPGEQPEETDVSGMGDDGDAPAAIAVEEEEHAPVSQGPAMTDDLGSDFDDMDFMSIHDASVDVGHEISSAGFEAPAPEEEDHGPNAGAEPDFKIVDMRVKEKAAELAAEQAGVDSAAATPKNEEQTQGDKPDAQSNQPKSKRKRGRKGKKKK